MVRRRFLPLEQMWDDEAYWLPCALAGETLAGTITYDEACKLVIGYALPYGTIA